MASAAERYEARHPGVDISDAQKQERGERMIHKEDRASHRRTGRTRGVIIPRVPWHETDEKGAA